jgi:hypothetical protein
VTFRLDDARVPPHLRVEARQAVGDDNDEHGNRQSLERPQPELARHRSVESEEQRRRQRQADEPGVDRHRDQVLAQPRGPARDAKDRRKSPHVHELPIQLS